MPLFISHITAMFTFLHRLENSDSNSLVYHALKESISLHTNKVNCWFSTVSCLREKLGLDLDVCKKMKLYKFKVELKKVLRKNFMIYWHKIKDISINTGKLCIYFTYKDTFKFEEYLHIKKFTYRQILCKFRISAHSLRIETGRYEKTKNSSGNYSKLEKENRICKFCNLRMVEDEFHFLLNCPLYSDIRHNFIDNIQRNCDNFHHLSEKNKFLWILTNEDNNILLKLCDFLLKGFNLRTVTSI